MVSPEQICLGLQSIAEDFQWLGIIQHILLITMVILLWKFRKRVGRFVSLYITLTFAIVSFLAIYCTENPFTGIVFGISAVLGLWEVFSPKMDYSLSHTLRIQVIIAVVAGFLGFWYPHFIDDKLLALIASPYGLIPCPTLIVGLSIFIVVYPFTNKVWHWWLTLIGLYYGIFGVIRLKVNLDLALVIVSVYSLYGMIVLALKNRPLGRPAI
jgi:hypothetical protein